jgi:enoyl-CoA hydratase/carnithine racemase
VLLVTILSDYENKYRCMKFQRDAGVLQITLHTDDGPFAFDWQTHRDFGIAFTELADDTENRVVILTGTGDRFCADFDYGSFALDAGVDWPSAWVDTRSHGRKMLTSFLDIDVPVIAAINGPALSHSELPLLADIVLASDNTVFQDATHFRMGIPPGDGMHIVWTTLIGLNRGRHFLLTGRQMTVAEALTLGVVSEVHPQGELLKRAWELARDWARLSPNVLRATRSVLTMEWQRLLHSHLDAGLVYEGIAVASRPPGTGDRSAGIASLQPLGSDNVVTEHTV